MKLHEILISEGLFSRSKPKPKVTPKNRVSTTSRDAFIVDKRTNDEHELALLRAKTLKAQGLSDVNRGEERIHSHDWTFS